MTTTDPGTAVPEEESIEWVEGSTPELSERERMLVRNARAEGYGEGERHGFRIGGEEAVRAMTALSSMLNDKRVIQALETLHYFIQAEREAST